jgi:outer membrane protein OmpA-like peptidoglycan-associated protein
MYKPSAFRIFQKALKHAVWVVTAVTLSGAPSYAAEPVKDNPLAGRYEGSEMTLGQIKDYDEVALIQGPMSLSKNAALYSTDMRKTSLSNANVVRAEGRVSNYQYKLPAGAGLAGVQRSYENNLKSKGFRVVFTCRVTKASDDGCFKLEPGANELRDPMDRFRVMLGVTDWPAKTLVNDVLKARPAIEFFFKESGRYLLMKREGADGTDYVSLALSEKASDMSYEHGKVIDESTAFLRVVESKAESGKITFLDATEMQKSLNETGRVNLYGIYFDTDKDTIKPESKPTLDEITKLMRDNKELRLRVVGHTDSTGNEPHNLDLSKRRAASVIRALTQADINSNRFTSRGAGASEPVAPNDTNEGRAKNRRVELVRM